MAIDICPPIQYNGWRKCRINQPHQPDIYLQAVVSLYSCMYTFTFKPAVVATVVATLALNIDYRPHGTGIVWQ